MKKEKKRRIVGVLDVCLGLLLIVSVLQPLLRTLWEQEDTVEEVVATVHVRLSDVPEQMCDCLYVGEALYTASGEAYGVLEAIEAEPAKIVLICGDGFCYGVREGQGRVDVTLQIAVRGRMGEGGFFWNGRSTVMRGQSVLLYGVYAAPYGEVVGVFAE